MGFTQEDMDRSERDKFSEFLESGVWQIIEDGRESLWGIPYAEASVFIIDKIIGLGLKSRVFEVDGKYPKLCMELRDDIIATKEKKRGIQLCGKITPTTLDLLMELKERGWVDNTDIHISVRKKRHA